MNDATTTIQQLRDKVTKLVDDRDWSQFHSPKNLAMDIAIEAAELMEKFVWLDVKASYEELEKNRQEIEDELADVFVVALAFANAAKIDIAKAVEHKLIKTMEKYPIEKAKGRHTKYDKL